MIHATSRPGGDALEARDLVDFSVRWHADSPDLIHNTWIGSGHPSAMLDGDLLYAADGVLLRRAGETGEIIGQCRLSGQPLGLVADRGHAVVGLLLERDEGGEPRATDLVMLDVTESFGKRLWSKAALDRQLAPAERVVPYDRTMPFRTGQLIRHSDLGQGMVVAQLTGRKLLVSFEAGARELRCGRGSTGGAQPFAIDHAAPRTAFRRYSGATISGRWVVAAYFDGRCADRKVKAAGEALALCSFDSGIEHGFPGIAEYECLAGGQSDTRKILGYTPLAADDAGFVCEPDGWPEDVSLFEIDASSARLAWTLPEDEQYYGYPTHWSLSRKWFVALVGCRSQPRLHRLFAIERSSGELRWQQDVLLDPEYDITDNVRLARCDDVLYLAWARPTISLLALALDSGEPLWSRSAFGFSYSDEELDRRHHVELDLVPCDRALLVELRTAKRGVLLRVEGDP